MFRLFKIHVGCAPVSRKGLAPDRTLSYMLNPHRCALSSVFSCTVSLMFVPGLILAIALKHCISFSTQKRFCHNPLTISLVRGVGVSSGKVLYI